MAVTVTAVAQATGFNPRATTSVWDITATADGDTTATITHGLIGTPQDVQLTPQLVAPALLSGWAVTGYSATTVTLTKATTANSGNAGIQVRAIVRVPHSLGQ